MLQGRSPSETANKDYPGRKTSKEPGDGGLAEYYLHQIRPFTSRTIYTRSNLEPDFFFFFVLFLFFSFLFLLRYRFPPSPSNNTETPANQRNAIVQYILVLTVLGTVAVKTQCLIGDKLLAQGVKGSTNGDTAIIASAQVEDGCGRERNLCMVVIVCRSQDRHTQGQDLIQEKRNMVSPT